MLLKSLVTVLFAAVSVFAQNDPTINTPTDVTYCLPSQLTFSGTQPPFIITAVPGGQINSPPLETIGTSSGNTLTWNVDIQPGTSITLIIRDNIGRTAYSAPFTILGTPGATCTAATSALVTATGPTTGAAVVTTGAVVTTTTAAGIVTTPVTTPTTTPTSAATHATTTAAAVVTTSKSGASSLQPMCMAGLMGLVGVAALL